MAHARQGVRDTTAGLYESLAHIPQAVAGLPGRVAGSVHSAPASEAVAEQVRVKGCTAPRVARAEGGREVQQAQRPAVPQLAHRLSVPCGPPTHPRIRPCRAQAAEAYALAIERANEQLANTQAATDRALKAAGACTHAAPPHPPG